MNALIWIVLILLFSLVSAGAAAYFAIQAGRRAGQQAEHERQRQTLQSAEDQAERILAEADTRIKERELALKEATGPDA